MSDALDLQALCVEYLAACVEALDTIPTFDPGLGGAPGRSFVSPGQPAFDCCDLGQLTVHAAAVGSDPVIPPKNQFRRNEVSLVATILRCVPSANEGDAPDAALMQASAAQVNADGWALWNHIFNLIEAGMLFTLCNKVIWDGMRSIAVAGNCGGWLLALRAELDGYEEIIST